MFQDFLNLFYPKLCQVCQEELVNQEEILCTNCLHTLPRTNFCYKNDNPVKKVFEGRIEIENAAALLYFKKENSVQELIHNLKYRGHNEISAYLGKWMGQELAASGLYSNIDAVIPVPLHKNKLKKRGFNQVEEFGREIALALNAQYRPDILVKRSATGTQTLKNRLSRWGNMEGNFMLDHVKELQGQHILLVDDLITTGATLEACARNFENIEGIKISLASMAITL